MGVSSHALAGVGRSENVSRARAVLCYVWMHCLGQSGRVLAEEIGVSPQPFMRLLLEWNGTVDWTRKPWKDGAGKIYCMNWQRPLCVFENPNRCMILAKQIKVE